MTREEGRAVVVTRWLLITYDRWNHARMCCVCDECWQDMVLWIEEMLL